MRIGNRIVLLCDCGGTIPLDGEAIGSAAHEIGLSEDQGAAKIHRHLCDPRNETLRSALAKDGKVLVACTQEIARFERLAREVGAGVIMEFINLRETAGWSEEAARATPKIMALLAAAAIEAPPDELISLDSAGHVLILGRDQTSVEAARRLARRHDVTLVLPSESDVLLPPVRQFRLLGGSLESCVGWLGAFEARFEDLSEVHPWSRGGTHGAPCQSPVIATDIVLDLSGSAPLFPDHRRRLGYLKADPARPAEIDRALFDLTDLVGPYAKPRYVTHSPGICAHSVGGKVTCTRCIDVCPTGAITSPAGKITVGAEICAGCGSCATQCPTGAMTYAAPPMENARRRLIALLHAFAAAGGDGATLLIYANGASEDSISALASRGPGLPANTLPFVLRRSTSIGLDFLLSAIALGAVRVLILLEPENAEEATALEHDIELGNGILTGLGHQPRCQLIVSNDPDVIREYIVAEHDLRPLSVAHPIEANDDRGSLVRAVAGQLATGAASIAQSVPLPAGAALGGVSISRACTLCMACSRACPTDALEGNARTLALCFTESRCVQCGLCSAVCPEDAITLEPRLAWGDVAFSPATLRADEVARCRNCNAPFGSKASIDGVINRLTASGWTEQHVELADRLRLCEQCRAVAQYVS